MYQLPQKLQTLVPYEPLTGSYPIRADANESFLAPPASLRAQIAKAVSTLDFNRYPDPNCTGLCRRFADFFGLEEKHIVAGNGSDELIGLIISSFTSAGESMAVVSPDFSMYAFYAQMNGVRVETFSKEGSELALDADALVAFAREKQVSLLILSNPCNPTSLAASREEILKIVDSLDCLVVIDEAYMDFAEGSILDLADSRDNLIVLKTCSKAFGMAAIRLGFAVANQTIIDAIRAVKSPYNVNSMTQAVGCLLLEQKDYLQACIRQIKDSRDALYRMICGLQPEKREILEVANTRANFVFLRLPEPEPVFRAMLKRGIAVRCLGRYLRISAGSEAENKAVLAALSDILN